MIADLFWTAATSGAVLAFLGVVLLAAALVGYTPLIQDVPFAGPYKPLGKFAFLLVAALIAFLGGVRFADEREALKTARVELERRNADLAIASKSAADARQKAADIEAAAYARAKSDSEYISSLEKRPVPACMLDDNDLRFLGGLRQSTRRGAKPRP